MGREKERGGGGVGSLANHGGKHKTLPLPFIIKLIDAAGPEA